MNIPGPISELDFASLTAAFERAAASLPFSQNWEKGPGVEGQDLAVPTSCIQRNSHQLRHPFPLREGDGGSITKVKTDDDNKALPL